MIFPVIFCIWSAQYQYLCVVNLSRRQTLIKIFTKYLPGANINISAIFTKQNQRLSIPCLQSHLNSRSMRNWLYWISFARKATFSSKHHWYSWVVLYSVYINHEKINHWISCWIPIRFKFGSLFQDNTFLRSLSRKFLKILREWQCVICIFLVSCRDPRVNLRSLSCNTILR